MQAYDKNRMENGHKCFYSAEMYKIVIQLAQGEGLLCSAVFLKLRHNEHYLTVACPRYIGIKQDLQLKFFKNTSPIETSSLFTSYGR